MTETRPPKWTRRFWIDLAERVGATLIGALLTLVGVNKLADLTPELAWMIIGVPVLTSLLKGLGANIADSESGASLVPSPPAGVVQPDYTPEHRRGEAGEFGLLHVLAVVGVVLLVLMVLGVLR